MGRASISSPEKAQYKHDREQSSDDEGHDASNAFTVAIV